MSTQGVVQFWADAAWKAQQKVNTLEAELARLAAENATLRRRLVEAGSTDPSEEWARDE